MRLALAATLSLLTVACYSPNIPNGAEQCSATGKCPEGFTCAVDNRCYKNGSAPTCPACSGATPVCDKTTLHCVACLADSDCPSTAKCMNKACVTAACSTCSGATPVCDTSTFTCVACLQDSDCGSGSLCMNKQCLAGCSAAHPTCGSDAGACDVDLGVCRGCNGDGECPSSAPRCNAGTCVACLPSSDNCPLGSYCAASGGGYACIAGCKSDSECQPTVADGGVADAGVPDGGTTASLLACCNHACLDTSSDTKNCGACGNACSGASVCCTGHCADLTSDVNNCSACCKSCAVANAQASCTSSACVVGQCNTGFADCNQMASDGCEANLATDPNNCSACGMVCPAVTNGLPGCANMMCGVGSCNTGFGDCNGVAGDGCETPTASDVNNCGTCSNVCAVPTNAATAACSGGMCEVGTCNTGFADCNGSASDGCEVNTTNDVNNCNKCGNVCPVGTNAATAKCVTSVCQVGSCNTGFADCNGSASDGCEINTTNDVNNCNGCKNVCSAKNATSKCSNSTCAISSCASGFADCNNTYSDGCETSTTSDPNNCSKCGMKCASGQTCINSVCTTSTCNANVLLLSDSDSTNNAVLVSKLQAVGLTVTLINDGVKTYANSPPATNFGAIVIFVGNDYGTDMPATGQQAIVSAALNNKVGVVFSEWAAYNWSGSTISCAGTGNAYATLRQVGLVDRHGGVTSTLTFTNTTSHPIWTGVPASFTTKVAMGGNGGSDLINGGTEIATCTECKPCDNTSAPNGAGVVVRDNGTGRIVQFAHAANYASAGSEWTNDPNLTLLTTNGVRWAARCM